VHDLGYSNITKGYTEVCLEHTHITDKGIIPLKVRVVDAKCGSVAFVIRKTRRRDKR
jgi:hypothetical protein